MNERSFMVLLLFVMCPPPTDSASTDRRDQILDAALRCFGRHGFHQTTMHHISAEAGISVGLIYRYFENKEAVISGMADAHKKLIVETMARARNAPTLLEALEIFFAAPCCEDSAAVQAAFLVDLFAEASRNPPVAAIIRDVGDEVKKAFVELIETAPEAQSALQKFTAVEIAELICAVEKGLAMREIVNPTEGSIENKIQRHAHVVRNLCRMLFSEAETHPARPREHKKPETVHS